MVEWQQMTEERGQQTDGQQVTGRPRRPREGVSRRQAIQYGLAGLAGLGMASALTYYLSRVGDNNAESTPGGTVAGTGAPATSATTGEAPVERAQVFPGDAPTGELWENWKKRGWVAEAQFYGKLPDGRVECGVCPNRCVLAPGDRSHCRNKVNKDGVLYTLAYGNPCALHVDPIEKKPLFHFLPGTKSFSLATAGCVFRCLNCQNWEISQRTPEQTKDATGPGRRLTASDAAGLTSGDVDRLSLMPQDVVDMAQALNCPSISYTYSDPIAYYEYAYDTCKLARAKKVRNVLVTCGYIDEGPLRDLAQYVDAAHVDLKGFDEPTYRKLNSGRLGPVLDTLKTLKSLSDGGMWFEIINLVVPTYTDKIETIKRMCSWIVENLTADCPLHFSRFMPLYKLAYLTPTPADILVQARQAAQSIGLRYVYIGNVRGLEDVQTTFCPSCKKPVIERDVFAVTSMNLDAGRCKFCKTKIAGVWA